MSLLEYRKSSFSGMSCVEVAPLPDGSVSVRNTRARTGPTLEFTRDEWVAFIAGAQEGEFDFGLDVAALRYARL
jgi:hypothetical protein